MMLIVYINTKLQITIKPIMWELLNEYGKPIWYGVILEGRCICTDTENFPDMLISK